MYCRGIILYKIVFGRLESQYRYKKVKMSLNPLIFDF